MSDTELFLSKISEVNNHLKSIDDLLHDMGEKISKISEGNIRNQLNIEQCKKDIDTLWTRHREDRADILAEVQDDFESCKKICRTEIKYSASKLKTWYVIGGATLLLGAISTLVDKLWK